ncbi:hypothetical protein C0992_004982 [Termitomyces sp. T32_za158]|nr:hypothetical protein C0992_004982 [Termitomyces sp. T32_za158]
MTESDGNLSIPPPLNIPPPPNFAKLQILADSKSDVDGESTMINQSQDISQTPSPYDMETDMEAKPSVAPDSPTPARRADPPWIIRRAVKHTAAPLSASTGREETLYASRLQSTLTQPPLSIPKSVIRSPAPAGGFPVVHMSTPPWYNLLPEQSSAFDEYAQYKIWVQEWQASKDVDLMVSSNKLKELIQRLTGEKARLSTPQPEKEIITTRRSDKHKPPYHFLTSGISKRAHDVLITHPIVSTPEATAYFVPYNPPLPTFLCMAEGFTLSIRTAEAVQESEEVATEIVRKTLIKNEALLTLLKSKLIGDETSQHNLDPAADIFKQLVVRLARGEELVDRTNMTRPRRPLWNVFFRAPLPIMWTNYFVILQSIRDVRFIDMGYGSATLVDEERRLHCFNCKGADHNHDQCEYAKLENWFGNKAAAKIEETAEFASSSRNDRNSTFNRNRNERRAEGWKTGGCGLPYGQRHDRR